MGTLTQRLNFETQNSFSFLILHPSSLPCPSSLIPQVMAWFRKKEQPKPPDPAEERTVRTEGLFVKCPGCEQMLFKREVVDNLNVCPKCMYHHRISALDRLRMTLDDGRWKELDAELAATDPLGFVDTKSNRKR